MNDIVGRIIRDENGRIRAVDEDNRPLNLESTVTLADRLMPVRPVYLYFATHDIRDSEGMVKCKYGVTDNLKRRQRQLNMKFVAVVANVSRYDALEDERAFHDFLENNGVTVQNEYFDAWVSLMIHIKRTMLGSGGRVIDKIDCIEDFIIDSRYPSSFHCIDCDDYCYPYCIEDSESSWNIVKTSLGLKYVYKCHACGSEFSLPTIVSRPLYDIANADGIVVPKIDITHRLEVKHSKTRVKQVDQRAVYIKQRQLTHHS